MILLATIKIAATLATVTASFILYCKHHKRRTLAKFNSMPDEPKPIEDNENHF